MYRGFYYGIPRAHARFPPATWLLSSCWLSPRILPPSPDPLMPLPMPPGPYRRTCPRPLVSGHPQCLHMDLPAYARVSIPEHSYYKWLLHMEGISASSRLSQVCAVRGVPARSGAAAVLVGRQNSSQTSA
jgi:hypothetical protein